MAKSFFWGLVGHLPCSEGGGSRQFFNPFERRGGRFGQNGRSGLKADHKKPMEIGGIGLSAEPARLGGYGGLGGGEAPEAPARGAWGACPPLI